jgi:hypothetical protein
LALTGAIVYLGFWSSHDKPEIIGISVLVSLFADAAEVDGDKCVYRYGFVLRGACSGRQSSLRLFD